jgi:tetratricopeptide (TPR) repeat protein
MKYASLVLVLGAFACSPQVRPTAPNEAHEASLFLERADTHAANGRSLLAEQYLVAAWDRGAPTPRVLPRLLEVCFQAGRLENLRTYVERGLRLDPESVALRYVRTEILYALGDHEEALIHLNSLIQYPDAPARAWLLRGELLAAEEAAWGEVKVMYQKYLEREPIGSEARRVSQLLKEHEYD